MFYYKVCLDGNVFNREKDQTGDGDGSRLSRAIRKSAAEYNGKHPDTFYTVSELSGDSAVIAVISKNSGLTADHVDDFLYHIRIGDFCETTICEQTLDDLVEMLGGPCCEKRAGEILSMFGLAPLRRPHCSDSVIYRERLLDSYIPDEAALTAAAGRNMSVASLKKEIKRIFACKAHSGAQGHPVHYFIGTDDGGIREKITDILLKALYANGRIKSRKYCRITFPFNGTADRCLYESLYTNCTGGAVVVDLSGDAGQSDGDRAGSQTRNLKLVCDVMKRFRHSVLTVICLPGSCGDMKRELSEELASCGMVTISEDMLDEKKSRGYLRRLAAGRNVGSDNKLYEELVPGTLYLPAELSGMFERWYDEKLRRSVYPRYRSVSPDAKKNVREKSKGCAYDELISMTGLAEAKETVTKALDYYKIQRLYKDFGVSQDRPAMHMVFSGNPGTAKTTAARIFARIMRENGILPSGHLVEVGRADLVGKYVGWTAQIVKQKFKEANGGVLFIDEAYSLADGDHGSFGEEAINTIVQEMENNRDDLIVIFAGYPDEMKTFLDTNPGLRSRIAFHIDFPDYSTEELCEIARHISESSGVTLSDGAVEKLAALFEQARTESDFGNGRFVRNVIEQSKMNLASRVLSMDPDSITKKILTTIEADDIIIPEIKKAAAQTVRRIGFSA